MDWDSVCRRAGGRRGYNWRRQFHRDYRLTLVVKLLDETGFRWGYQTRIAERLGVSRATISRDIARLFRRVWGGKEAEQRHDRQEAMKRGQRREDDLERKRLARTATEPQADGITFRGPALEAGLASPVPAARAPEPLAPAPEPPPPPLPSPSPPQVPQWVSGVSAGMGDIFRPGPSRHAERRRRPGGRLRRRT